MLGNLHTHTEFSDGTAPPEAYIAEAARLGFSVLGFSDHSPVPFPNTFAIPEGGLDDYVESIQQLKAQSTGLRTQGPGHRAQGAESGIQSAGDPMQASGTVIASGAKQRHHCHCEKRSDEAAASGIMILLGLEYDYIPGLTTPLSQLREEYPFDYIIGSVHLIRNDRPDLLWFIDGPQSKTYDKGLRDVFGGDARKAVTTYWRQLQEMIGNEKPDIIGHLDKIKMHKHNRYFREDEPWFVALAEETLDLIGNIGAVVEVNTRGIYKQRSDTLFPGPDLLKRIRARNIPVTVTSDAHTPEELALFFTETCEMLRTIGFRSQRLLTRGSWHDVSL